MLCHLYGEIKNNIRFCIFASNVCRMQYVWHKSCMCPIRGFLLLRHPVVCVLRRCFKKFRNRRQYSNTVLASLRPAYALLRIWVHQRSSVSPAISFICVAAHETAFLVLSEKQARIIRIVIDSHVVLAGSFETKGDCGSFLRPASICAPRIHS